MHARCNGCILVTDRDLKGLCDIVKLYYVIVNNLCNHVQCTYAIRTRWCCFHSQVSEQSNDTNVINWQLASHQFYIRCYYFLWKTIWWHVNVISQHVRLDNAFIRKVAYNVVIIVLYARNPGVPSWLTGTRTMFCGIITILFENYEIILRK